MSVESTEALERSVLESKDREQLLAIAGALGVKATSRAKKADIIAKILEQTGVAGTDDAPGRKSRARNGNGRGSASVTEAPTPTPEAEPVAGSPAAAPAAETPSAVAEPDREPPAEWELALEGETPASDGAAPAEAVAVVLADRAGGTITEVPARPGPGAP